MKYLTELEVYKLAEKLSDMIWNEVSNWKHIAQRTIGYQVINSSDSIAANISEGYGRFSTRDRRRFYIFARGSFEETKTWLRKAFRRNLIARAKLNDYKEILNELGAKLNAFIRSTA